MQRVNNSISSRRNSRTAANRHHKQQPIRTALDQIRRRPGTISHRRPDPLATTNASQAFGLHQTSESLAADVLAVFGQICMNPRSPVGLSRLSVEAADLGPQPLILLRMSRWLSAAPRIVAAGGDLQHLAHRGNRMIGPIRTHEFEPRDGIDQVSCANQAAAFFRISRSSRSRRFSRRNRRSSSRSAVVKPSSRRPSSRSA